MKFFNKAKELFNKMTGREQPAPAKALPPAAAPVPLFVKAIPKYQQEQRDFRARAAATKLLWNSGAQGTMVKGRNAAKRSLRARLEPTYGRRWKKQHVGPMDLAVSA